jgi:uncharacterized membrane protein YoaK (UPF0700 family)
VKSAASVVRTGAIHVFVLFFVSITPPLWYDFWSKHYSAPDLQFAGGLVWVLYVGYWLLKLSRNWPGTAAILSHLSAIFLAFAVGYVIRVSRDHELIIVAAPAVVALLGSIWALVMHWRKPREWTRKWAWGVLIALPFGLLCSAVFAIGLATAHGPLRY